MYKTLISLSCSAMLLLTGCNASNRLSQAQLNAIETREVDASMNETYNAASGALFDAGYTIAMSDRQGGLLTGTKATDKSAARFWISPYIEDIKFAVSIQIRETTPKICTVRIKTSINGAPKVDKKAIDELWVLMQRQVLMKEPLSSGTIVKTPYADNGSSVPNTSEPRKTDEKIVSNETSEKESEDEKIAFVVGYTKCSICGRDIGKDEMFCLYKLKRVCPSCFKAVTK